MVISHPYAWIPAWCVRSDDFQIWATFCCFFLGLSTSCFGISNHRVLSCLNPLTLNVPCNSSTAHLFDYYLNTCKKICHNFPLCFWSGLLPIFQLRCQFGTKQFLSLSGGSWMYRPDMYWARAMDLCQFSPLYHRIVVVTLPFLFFCTLWWPLCQTHTGRTQVEMHKNLISLSPFTHSHNIHSVRAGGGWNKEIFGVVQWFVIVSIV